MREGRVSGTARVLLNILRYLPGMKRDWQFVVFINQYNREEDFPRFPNLTFIRIPEKHTFLWDQIKLPLFLKRNRISLFFSPYYKRPLWKNCFSVVIIHDVIPFLVSNNRKIRIQLTRYWWKMLASGADRILTVSEFSKKEIIKTLSLPEYKIRMIYNGLDKTFVRSDSCSIDKVLTKYGISGRYILYIGNFSPHKNVQGLVRAYSELPEGLKSSFNLVLVGSGDERESLQEQVSDLGLKGNVIFTGEAADKDLPSIYSGAELLVFPSFYEGFGLPAVEAMGCGIPVIVSRGTALQEIVSDAGVLVDPHDTGSIREGMERLLTDCELREVYVCRGLKRARCFSFKDTAAAVSAVFEQILEGTKR